MIGAGTNRMNVHTVAKRELLGSYMKLTLLLESYGIHITAKGIILLIITLLWLAFALYLSHPDGEHTAVTSLLETITIGEGTTSLDNLMTAIEMVNTGNGYRTTDELLALLGK